MQWNVRLMYKINEKEKRTMAFKNIRIPKESIKEYEVDGEIIEPWFCTIDEEKNIILFDYGTVYEEPDEIYFALIWKNKIIKSKLHQKVVNKNTTIWELLAINIPKDIEVYRDEIIADLREAMKVYGFDGDAAYLFNMDESLLNKTGKTIINF